jgi:hypothetical protein
MVNFLLDNSLGAWWAARCLTKRDREVAQTEEDLRKKVSLEDMPLEFLRFEKKNGETWCLAAGNFDDWPTELSQLKILDPCCGSGHFLVAAFLMLVPMRMKSENISACKAIQCVLQENLHGLEIDRRCVELAVFALAMAAWRYPNAGGYRKLPEFNIACSGLAITASKENWLSLAGDNAKLQYALSVIYEQFEDAPVLGSLINPELGLNRGTLFEIKWEDIEPLLAKAFLEESTDEKTEIGVVAQGTAKAAFLLSSKFHLVITNVPYLTRGRQNDTLRNYCEKHFNTAKNDLATSFLDRCISFCCDGGTSSTVLPQNWLFLGTYKEFRITLFQKYAWNMIARLGPGAFETISGEVVKAILLTLSKINIIGKDRLDYECKNNIIRGLDISNIQSSKKADGLKKGILLQVKQSKQLENPDAIFTFDDNLSGPLLGTYAKCLAGLNTGDSFRFRFKFWEFPALARQWIYELNAPNETTLFSGREHILRWENGQGDLVKCPGAGIRNVGLWGSNGVCVSVIGNLSATLCLGTSWDRSAAMLLPKNKSDLLAIWAFCSSNDFSVQVRKLNQKLSVAESAFEKVPFDVSYWMTIATKNYPQGLPKPYSDDPTQWIFYGHPASSVNPLQVAVAKLVGYRWPPEIDSSIEISETARCLMEKSEALSYFSDKNGIVCIPSVRGELKAEERLENLLAVAYGTNSSLSTISSFMIDRSSGIFGMA